MKSRVTIPEPAKIAAKLRNVVIIGPGTTSGVVAMYPATADKRPRNRSNIEPK